MTRITLADCAAILDQHEDSPAYAQFKNLAIASNKFTKGVGAGQSFKKDGVNVCFEYENRKWTVHTVQLYPKKESRFAPWPGEIAPGVTMAANRAGIIAALGTPSSNGGNGTVDQFGLVNHLWERWDYDLYSLRFDYETDESTVYLASIQRPSDVQKWESTRTC